MSNIVITGANGLVGTALKKVLAGKETYACGSKDIDCLNFDDTFQYLRKVKPGVIVHLAALVGGVESNSQHLYDYFYQNILMNSNMIDLAIQFRSRFITLLSVCIYPNKHRSNLREDLINDGEPHDSNYGYAYAKRMNYIQCKAAHQQYGLSYSCLCPNNLYGINDNFDPNHSHVIPAIVRKIWRAKHLGEAPLFFGDGTQVRQFTFAQDLARLIGVTVDRGDFCDIMNVGDSSLHSIKEIIDLVCKEFEYPTSKIGWSGKNGGQDVRVLDVTKSKNFFENQHWTPIDEGISEVCRWYSFQKETGGDIRE